MHAWRFCNTTWSWHNSRNRNREKGLWRLWFQPPLQHDNTTPEINVPVNRGTVNRQSASNQRNDSHGYHCKSSEMLRRQIVSNHWANDTTDCCCFARFLLALPALLSLFAFCLLCLFSACYACFDCFLLALPAFLLVFCLLWLFWLLSARFACFLLALPALLALLALLILAYL